MVQYPPGFPPPSSSFVGMSEKSSGSTLEVVKKVVNVKASISDEEGGLSCEELGTRVCWS